MSTSTVSAVSTSTVSAASPASKTSKPRKQAAKTKTEAPSVPTSAVSPVSAETSSAPVKPSKRSSKAKTASPVVSVEPVAATPDATTAVVSVAAPAESSATASPVSDSSENRFRRALSELRTELETQQRSVKDFRGYIKKLESAYQFDLSRASKMRKRKTSQVKPTGFVKELELPKELADLIGADVGTRLSMPSYTKKFYEMLKQNKLFYEKDGRVLRANAEIKRVFNLPDSVNESTDYKDKNGFNFYTLQKHIAAVNKRLQVASAPVVSAAAVTAVASS